MDEVEEEPRCVDSEIYERENTIRCPDGRLRLVLVTNTVTSVH